MNIIRLFSGSTLVGFIACLFVVTALTTANAQFTIEIGISRDKAVRAMVSRGYDQIQIVRKGFKTVQAEACLNGTRFLVRVDDDYRVSNLNQIGVCRRVVTMDTLEENLKKNGYTRIVMEPQNANFVALACRGDQRVRITFSQQGEVLQRRAIGECREIFEPNDIRPILRDAGYNRIKFTDRQLPWYSAEACKDGRRYELLLTRKGEIRRTQRIGRCAERLQPNRITAFLEEKGYNRVEVIDDQLPGYVAAACQKNQRVELSLDRWGEITGRQVIGKCPSSLDREQIVELLVNEGFTRVEVAKSSNGNFEISACRDGIAKYAVLSRYGELISERDGKRCKERSISEILDRLDARGFRNTTIYAEGCRRGNKVRLHFDRNGDRINRELLGKC